MKSFLTVLTVMTLGTAESWSTAPSTAQKRNTFALFYKANSAGHEQLPIDQHMKADPSVAKEAELEKTTLEMIKRRYVVDPTDDPTAMHTFKSDVFKARRKCEKTGEAMGEQVVVKLSMNHHGMARESEAYDVLQSHCFVRKHEYFPGSHETDASVIVMDCGEVDLTKYINNNFPLPLGEIREKSLAAVDTLNLFHKKNIVWCDLKTCNFVVLKSGEVKGIDLEAATFVGTPNYMHTGAGSPPEYALEHLEGRNTQMELSFDIWSLGMVLYHFAVGENYYAPICELSDANTIFEYLRDHDQLDFTKLKASNADPRLKHLIISCLQYDPFDRPTIQQVKEHPFYSRK
jgi:serine/threonine protein kinase